MDTIDSETIKYISNKKNRTAVEIIQTILIKGKYHIAYRYVGMYGFKSVDIIVIDEKKYKRYIKIKQIESCSK